MSDSAVCRNLRDWIPSAGTVIATDSERTQVEKRPKTWEKNGPHIQLVVNIGSILQQSVHHLGMTILRGDGESCATVLPQEKQPAVRQDSC